MYWMKSTAGIANTDVPAKTVPSGGNTFNCTNSSGQIGTSKPMMR